MRILIAGLILILVAMAALVRPKEERAAGAPPRASASAGGAALRFVHHIDWYEQAIEETLKTYNARKGALPVQQKIMPTSGLEMFFRTQLIAGEAPELMGIQEHKRFGRMGMLLDLQPLLDRPNPYLDPRRPWRDHLPEAALLNVRAADGAIYGLPYERADIGFIYNERIFRKVGLSPPATWAEWMAACRKLQAAGYVPIAWDGQHAMGSAWFIRTLLDATFRELEPALNARPTDPGVVYDPSSQSADAGETIDLEELYRAYHRGLIAMRGPRMKFAYDRLEELSRFFQPGFAVAPQAEMKQLFLDQRAACVVQGTFFLDPARDRIKDELAPKDQFPISIFPMPRFHSASGATTEGRPPSSDDRPPPTAGALAVVGGRSSVVGRPLREPYHTGRAAAFRIGAIRSTGGFGAGLVFALPARLKGARREAAIDFMHYMYSRPVYTKVYTNSPKLGAPIYAELPCDPGTRRFQSRGSVKIDLLPSDPQQSAEWYIHLQAYLFDRIDWEEFARRCDRLFRVSLERDVKRGTIDPKKALALGKRP